MAEVGKAAVVLVAEALEVDEAAAVVQVGVELVVAAVAVVAQVVGVPGASAMGAEAMVEAAREQEVMAMVASAGGEKVVAVVASEEVVGTIHCHLRT